MYSILIQQLNKHIGFKIWSTPLKNKITKILSTPGKVQNEKSIVKLFKHIKRKINNILCFFHTQGKDYPESSIYK